jgi:hypothetical protein
LRTIKAKVKNNWSSDIMKSKSWTLMSYSVTVLYECTRNIKKLGILYQWNSKRNYLWK